MAARIDTELVELSLNIQRTYLLWLITNSKYLYKKKTDQIVYMHIYILSS